MTKQAIQEKVKELRAKGYWKFGWGDFWNTGFSARAALRHGSGKQQSTAKSDPIMWDCIEGPKGGCWIRYQRKSRRAAK